MNDLIRFLISNITGSDDFEIEESTDERGELFTIKAKPEIIGLIIGKGGKMIKNIRKIASIRATMEKKYVNINITE